MRCCQLFAPGCQRHQYRMPGAGSAVFWIELREPTCSTNMRGSTRNSYFRRELVLRVCRYYAQSEGVKGAWKEQRTEEGRIANVSAVFSCQSCDNISTTAPAIPAGNP
jgi:hypothetical protein